ncbi:MAG: DUF4397 domain-containing protein [Ferruginibacter sp.]
MKKGLRSVRFSRLALAGIILMALSFSACKKSLDVNNNTPAAALMAFNLAPDKAAVGIAIGGNNLTNIPLGYTSYTGAYLNIYPGTREVASYDYNSNDSAFAIVTQNFELNKYYSVFTLGANGTYRNVVVNDGLESLSDSSGKAFVRYINAIPDSTNPVVTITANGTDLTNNSTSFATVSGFTGIAPGDITIKVANGTNISANRTITLEKGKVYTVLVVGIPGNADPAKLVQIKYITNGTID